MTGPEDGDGSAPADDGTDSQAEAPDVAPALQVDQSLIVESVKGSGTPLEHGAVHLTEHKRG